MSHYTYMSGVATDTFSLRCPVCLALRPVTKDMIKYTPTIEQLCCEQHVQVYKDRVYKIEERLWLALKEQIIPSRIKKRITVFGTLSSLVSHHLSNYGVK